MKGVIFTLFQEMVEDQFDLDTWELMIESCDLPSQGIYTTVKTYDDDEIVQLISALSQHTRMEATRLIESFGHFLLPHLIHSLPPTIDQFSDLWTFLAAIDDVIHTEVKKLDPEAMTPTIKVKQFTDDSMLISYESPRKLCFLAMGLITQAGDYFNQPVEVQQTQCMHDGHDHCELQVRSAT